MRSLSSTMKSDRKMTISRLPTMPSAEQRDVGQRSDEVAANVAEVVEQVARGRDEVDLEAEALQAGLESAPGSPAGAPGTAAAG